MINIARNRLSTHDRTMYGDSRMALKCSPQSIPGSYVGFSNQCDHAVASHLSWKYLSPLCVPWPHYGEKLDLQDTIAHIIAQKNAGHQTKMVKLAGMCHHSLRRWVIHLNH